MKEDSLIHIFQPGSMRRSETCLTSVSRHRKRLQDQNRITRWFSIYFPEIKDVYRNPDAVGGLMVIKQAPLPCDIKGLGVDGVNKIWRDARLKGAGIKRAKTLVTAAEHSIGNTEAPRSARKEIRNLLNDYEIYKSRMDELMEEIEELLSGIPYIDKLMEIHGIGIKR